MSVKKNFLHYFFGQNVCFKHFYVDWELGGWKNL